MEKRNRAKGARKDRPSASMSYAFQPSLPVQGAEAKKEYKLDHTTSKLTAAKPTEMTPEKAKEKAIKGELGWTEMPAKQVW